MGLEQRREVASWLLSEHINHLDYPEDLDRIQGILHEEGYSISYHEIQKFWREVSRASNLEWKELPKYDGTILTTFEVYKAQGDLL